MRKTPVIVAFLAMAASTCLGQDWATKMFKITDHDFGTVRVAQGRIQFHFV